MADEAQLIDLINMREYRKQKSFSTGRETSLPTHASMDRTIGKLLYVPIQDAGSLGKALANERSPNLSEFLTDRFRFFVDVVGSEPIDEEGLRALCKMAACTVVGCYGREAEGLLTANMVGMAAQTCSANAPSAAAEEGGGVAASSSLVARIVFPNLLVDTETALRLSCIFKCHCNNQLGRMEGEGGCRRWITGFYTPNEEAIYSPRWEQTFPRERYLPKRAHPVCLSCEYRKCTSAMCTQSCSTCAGRKCVPSTSALRPVLVASGTAARTGEAERTLLCRMKTDRPFCYEQTFLRSDAASVTLGFNPPKGSPHLPMKVTQRGIELPELFKEEKRISSTEAEVADGLGLFDTASKVMHLLRRQVQSFQVGENAFPYENVHILGVRKYGVSDHRQRQTYKVIVGGIGSTLCMNNTDARSAMVAHTRDELAAGGRAYFLVDKDGIHQRCHCTCTPAGKGVPCHKYASKGQALDHSLANYLGFRTSHSGCSEGIWNEIDTKIIPGLELLINGHYNPRKRRHASASGGGR